MVVSSGDSLGGTLIFRSTLVTSISSMVLSICSVVSERLSSSFLSMMVGGDSEYLSSTGEFVDESSEENWELKDGFFWFLGLEGLELSCWVIGVVVVRRVW